MQELAWVNGEIVPLSEAKIPLEDRALFFGDGGYEVIRVYGGRPFMLNEHISRFKRTLDGLDIRFEHIEVKLEEVVVNLLEKSALFSSVIYAQISRGTYRRQHNFPSTNPNLIAIVYSFDDLDEALYENGVVLRSVEDYRWGRCDLKTLNLLPNVLERQRALDSGFYDSVFVGQGGLIREATSANIFVRKGDSLFTHPLTTEILGGITRQRVCELAEKIGYRVEEQAVKLDELSDADEVFLTGTTVEVLPVCRMDELEFKAPFDAAVRLREALRQEAATQ